MREKPVRLRPIEEADLDALRRLDTDPSVSELPDDHCSAPRVEGQSLTSR
jgi:hypothetical protein